MVTPSSEYLPPQPTSPPSSEYLPPLSDARVAPPKPEYLPPTTTTARPAARVPVPAYKPERPSYAKVPQTKYGAPALLAPAAPRETYSSAALDRKPIEQPDNNYLPPLKAGAQAYDDAAGYQYGGAGLRFEQTTVSTRDLCGRASRWSAREVNLKII